MAKKSLLILLFSLVFLSMSCLNLPTATPDQSLIETAVANTLNAQGGPGPVNTSAAGTSTGPADTPITPAASETAANPTASCQPLHPGAQILPLPAGVAAGLEQTLRLVDFQGNVLSTRALTGMTLMDSSFAHLAGNLAQGADALPVVYFTFQNNGSLKLNANNSVSDLASIPNLTFLIGVEGSSFLAYVTIDMMNEWTNRIYVGDLAAISGASASYTWVPSQDGHNGNAIRPLAIHTSSGAPDGLWFTYTMEGIGDINFPPYRGLFFFRFSTNQPEEFLPVTSVLGGISPDQTTIAYAPAAEGTTPELQNGFRVRNLITCQETNISFNPASNLGGGFVVFSPDNQLVAWVEANGPNNMEADFRLRVTRTDGTSMFDAPMENLGGFLGGEAPNWIRTVGWAANHLLMMDLYLNILHHSVLVIWAPDRDQPLDPVLGANQSAPISDGSFMGFIYP
jgi:hypothetical protein